MPQMANQVPFTTVPQLIGSLCEQLSASARHLEKGVELASELEAVLHEIVFELGRLPDHDLRRKVRAVRRKIRAERIRALAQAVGSILADASASELPGNIDSMVFPARTLARHTAVAHSPLSARVKNALSRRGLRTLGDVGDRLSLRELRALPNVGRNSVRELVEVLGKAGLSFRSDWDSG
jgi:hypothetical protein